MFDLTEGIPGIIVVWEPYKDVKNAFHFKETVRITGFESMLWFLKLGSTVDSILFLIIVFFG